MNEQKPFHRFMLFLFNPGSLAIAVIHASDSSNNRTGRLGEAKRNPTH
ncbi:hypothetical protein [Leptolyngbya sp. FACHB-671]|nr:hypothetical protein [Leptolyngbya sp. FACHB-671]